MAELSVVTIGVLTEIAFRAEGMKEGLINSASPLEEVTVRIQSLVGVYLSKRLSVEKGKRGERLHYV